MDVACLQTSQLALWWWMLSAPSQMQSSTPTCELLAASLPDMYLHPRCTHALADSHTCLKSILIMPIYSFGALAMSTHPLGWSAALCRKCCSA